MTRWLQAARAAAEARTKPTKPTEPTRELHAGDRQSPEEGVSSVSSVSSGREGAVARPSPDDLDALDRFEERAAIREIDGGQPRAEAEAAALAETAEAVGASPEVLRRLWADHPDARDYHRHLVAHGPATVGAAGRALGWGATRAWQAEARLRAAGLVGMDPLGRAVPVRESGG